MDSYPEEDRRMAAEFITLHQQIRSTLADIIEIKAIQERQEVLLSEIARKLKALEARK